MNHICITTPKNFLDKVRQSVKDADAFLTKYGPEGELGKLLTDSEKDALHFTFVDVGRERDDRAILAEHWAESGTMRLVDYVACTRRIAPTDEEIEQRLKALRYEVRPSAHHEVPPAPPAPPASNT